MITPEPPAGSEHYREGWRHGYEQAAIDRERSTDAVLPDTGQREALATVRAVWGQGAPEAKAALREQPPRWPQLCAALDVLAGAVPDTGQACTACTSRGAPVCCCERPADLAYARSEVDKWLASNDPYCILPTRTEHIPALLARLDELEGAR